MEGCGIDSADRVLDTSDLSSAFETARAIGQGLLSFPANEHNEADKCREPEDASIPLKTSNVIGKRITSGVLI